MMWKRVPLRLRLLPIVVFGLPAVAFGQTASGFDADGRSTFRVGARPADDVRDAVRLASGAVLLAGSFSGGAAGQAFLARLLPDGAPDPAFGTAGVVTLPARSSGLAVAAHPDGGAVLLATTGVVDPPVVTLARVTDDGSFVANWGTGGVAMATIPGVRSVTAIAVSAVGRIYVSGFAGDPAHAVVLRFDAGGTLDPLYGIGGLALSGVDDTAAARLVLTASGAVYAAGIDNVFSSPRHLAVFCFNSAGIPCPGFGGGTGMATSSLGAVGSSVGSDVAVDGLGRIVVGGQSDAPSGQAALARFTATGAADAGFNGGLGYRLLGFSGTSHASSLAVDATNRIVVTGYQAADLFSGTPRLAMAARVTAAGAGDGTFGTGGRFTQSIGGADLMQSVSIDAGTGRILLAGSSGPTLGVRSATTLALTTDGIPDPTYGSDGVVVASLSSVSTTSVSEMAVQPDGRMLVGGSAAFPEGQRPYVARLNLDGTLDPSFGSGGVVTLPGTVGTSINRVAAAPDGGSLAVLLLPESVSSHAMIHLGSDGSFDTGFGSSGLATIPAIPHPLYSNVLPLPDGGALAAGRENDAPGEILVARFTAQGGLDLAFGAGGASKLTGVEGSARHSRVLADGRIVLAAAIDSSPALVRLTATGAPDPTFDADGLASVTALSGSGTHVLSADDSGILLGGSLSNAGGLVLARFDPSGAPATSFGTGGVVTDATIAPTSGLAGMALDGAGCIVVAGMQGPIDARYAVLARFLPDGGPDPTFGTAGGTTPNLGALLSTTTFALDGNGNALIGGTTSNDADQLGLVARLPAACTDGNACTVDQCAAGVGCTHTQLLGIAGARCLCGVLPAACTGQSQPASVSTKADKACSALAAAESAADRKRKKGLAKARRLLKQAIRNATRAARGKKPKLTPDCATALRAGFTEQRTRALEAIKNPGPAS